MRTFSGAKPSQRPDELKQFIRILRERECMSYLEVGARHGDTFHAVMTSLPKGAFGVAVDLPGGPWGTSKSKAALERAVKDLHAKGYDVHVVFGDAKYKKIRDIVRNLAGKPDPSVPPAMHFPPFDACLIDADHRYSAVMRDFENFAPMCSLVALHDIDGHGVRQKRTGLPVEVPQAWAEIKAQSVYPGEEIIGRERGMGIGVIYQDAEPAVGAFADPAGSPPEADDAD